MGRRTFSRINLEEKSDRGCVADDRKDIAFQPPHDHLAGALGKVVNLALVPFQNSSVGEQSPRFFTAQSRIAQANFGVGADREKLTAGRRDEQVEPTAVSEFVVALFWFGPGYRSAGGRVWACCPRFWGYLVFGVDQYTPKIPPKTLAANAWAWTEKDSEH